MDRHCSRQFKVSFLSLGLYVLFAATPAFAEPVSVSGSLDNRFSDNMERVADEEQSDVETRVSISVRHVKDPGQCNSVLDGTLGYGYWFDDTFDPQAYTDLGFEGDCNLTPGLRWLASNRLSDVRESSRRPDVPDNSTRKNVFTTGPEYTLLLGSRDQLQFTVQYQNTEFEEPDQSDSDRVIGSVAWNHFFSVAFSGGLTLNTNRAELDSGVEINRNSANLTFNKAWPATRLDGSFGVSEIETTFNSGSQKSDAIVGDIGFIRQINPSTDFFLNASRELSDQTSDFDFRFGDFEFNLTETDTVEVTALKAGIDKVFSGGSALNVSISGSRSDYLASGNVEERTGAEVFAIRPITPRTSVNSSISLDYLSYQDDDSEDTLIAFDLGISHQLSRDLGVNLRIGHERRSSDFVLREYEENWLVVGVSYRFL